jgi:hypothetical protein
VRLAVAASAAVSAAATAARPTGLGEAVRAVDRLVTARLKWDQCVVAAGGAGNGEHLTIAAATTVAATTTAIPATTGAVPTATTATRATTGHPAIAAPTGIVGEATAGEELLLAHREDERLTAIAAAQNLVRVTHADTSKELGGFVSASRVRDWGRRWIPRGRPLAACETYQRGPV